MCAFWVLNPALYLLELFIWGQEWNQIGGWSYIERSERGCIRNRSGVGRTERGLVSRKDGCRSGRVGFERGCIRDTARIQRGLIGDRYALQSERVFFLPDHTRPSHKNWSGMSGDWSGVWCECSFTGSKCLLRSQYVYAVCTAFYTVLLACST